VNADPGRKIRLLEQQSVPEYYVENALKVVRTFRSAQAGRPEGLHYIGVCGLR
jgi:hypothetical protein